MKEKFVEPELRIISFEAMNVLTTSDSGRLDEDELPPVILDDQTQ